MKKALTFLLALCLLCANARADQADDLIATLTESDKASVYIALTTANLTHKEGDPYSIKIRLREGTVEYTFTDEEYAKLKAWYDGEYKAPEVEESSARSDLSDLEATNQWKHEHGYDFPIYGSTSADLSPISDYLTLLSENGIYIMLPELVISHDHAEYEWIYSTISDPDFYMLYMSYNDGSKYKMLLQVPISYRPQYEALAYLIVSVLDIEYQEADDLLYSLQYNVIDHASSIGADDYALDYFENAKIGGFLALTVTKFAK